MIQCREIFSEEMNFLLLISLFQITFQFVRIKWVSSYLGFNRVLLQWTALAQNACLSYMCLCSVLMAAEEVHSLEVEEFVSNPKKHI